MKKEDIQIAKAKQFVFNARTTETGLKELNEVKSKMELGWDEFVIDGMCGHYKLDKAVMTLPKKSRLPKNRRRRTSPQRRKAERNHQLIAILKRSNRKKYNGRRVARSFGEFYWLPD